MGGGTQKQFLPLKHHPLIWYALSALDRAPEINHIVVAVPPEDGGRRPQALGQYVPAKEIWFVAGGVTRQESVFHALRALAGLLHPPDVVVVQDAARPFLTGDLLGRVLDAVAEWPAVAPAVPVRDTIKVADPDGLVIGTPDREKLKAIQTPQAFQFPTLYLAHLLARRRGLTATDDAALVELAGQQVRLVPGSDDNIKITTPQDLLYAEFLLDRGVPGVVV